MSDWNKPSEGRQRLGPRGDSDLGGRGTILLALIAASVFVAVGSLSVRQVTSPETALPILGAGISSIVDLDRYLADQMPAIEEQLAAPENDFVALPGFPIDVFVTDEDLSAGPDELRALVLSRSAVRLYAEGSSAFDQTGNQSIKLLSGEVVIRLVVNRVNADTYRIAGWCALISSVVIAGSAAILILQQRRLSRSVGGAILIGALPGIALSVLAWFLAGLYGPGPDLYAAEVRSVIRAGIEISFRNYAIAATAGVALAGLAFVASLLERLSRRASARTQVAELRIQ